MLENDLKLSLVSDLEEQIILSSIENKTFECEFFNNYSKKLFDVNFTINYQNNNILIELKDKNESLKINLNELISFKNENELDNEKILKIKSQITENNLNNKQLFKITFIPKCKKTKGNLLSCIFCCNCFCKKEYNEREIFVMYFLIKSNIINEISTSLNYNPKLNELQPKNRKRKLLAFINPISGKGYAISIWNKAKKILLEANLLITEKFTQKEKDAYETVLNLGINDYDGIINCSGDGILHEIINGIMHKKDRDIFLNRIIVSAIPGGSANGFSKAISDYCNEDNKVETHCYFIIKGISKKIDLNEYELKNYNNKIYSFLTLTWGFIADCDLESENMRFLGMFRTTLMGVIRFFCFRKYFGSFYYLPKESNVDINNIPSINENFNEDDYDLIKENDQYNFFIANNTKFVSENQMPNPISVFDDGLVDIIYLKGSDSGKWILFNELFYYLDDGNKIIKDDNSFIEGIHYIQTKFFRLIPKSVLSDPDDVNNNINFNPYYSIDGERYNICPLQCKVLEKVLSVYSGKE